jgi:outer membrane protein
MKFKIILLALALCIGWAAPALSQKLWSLNDCIDYALQNNIEVKQRALQVEQSEIELSTARNSRLPDLGASISAETSFGRTIGKDNVYVNSNQQSGYFNISSSMPVFQGMRINKQIKGGKLNLAAAMQDLERAREDISINVMTLYLEVLYNKEMVGVAENQLALSSMNVERSREQVDAGKLPISAVYESEALKANDQLSLTQAKNDLQMALLNLSQALNRESAAGFDVLQPDLAHQELASMRQNASMEAIYNYAADNRPGIKAERLRLESSENSVRIAKSDLYPSISLKGSYGTRINSLDSLKLWTQMSNNRSGSVGLTMNIPIFNRMATRNKIRSARVTAQNQQLVLNNTELALRKEIEQAWYNADAAYSKYLSADAALSSAKVAFNFEQEKSAAGRSTIFDFNDAKTRMQRAEAELVQAKYEFVFRSKILDFYNGRPIVL